MNPPGMKRHFREWSVAFVLGALLLVLAVFAPRFFQRGQLLSILSATVPVLVVACGVALVIISRQIDISVGSQFALCSVFLGLLIRAHWPMPVAALVSVLAGACFGAFNGALIAVLGLPSIVVTLATMVTWREALRWWREGEFVRYPPERFQWFGLGQAGGRTAVVVITAIVFGLLLFGMKHLSAGRYVYAVGSDSEAARLAGIRPRAVTFGVFVLVGVLLLGCIAPALVFLNLQPQWEKALQGCIILLAVAADGWRTVKGKN